MANMIVLVHSWYICLYKEIEREGMKKGVGGRPEKRTLLNQHLEKGGRKDQ